MYDVMTDNILGISLPVLDVKCLIILAMEKRKALFEKDYYQEPINGKFPDATESINF